MEARQVSLVRHVCLPFDGTVNQDAIFLDDFDQDGAMELLVGDVDGNLTIYKGTRKWITASNLGSIVCIFHDYFISETHKSIVVVSGEGTCLVFQIESGAEKVSSDSDEPIEIVPDHRFKIPWNVTCAIMACVTDDDTCKKDLVVASHSGGMQDHTKVTVLSDLSENSLDTVTEWVISGAAVSMTQTVVANNNSVPVIVIGLQYGGLVSIELDGTAQDHPLLKDFRKRNHNNKNDSFGRVMFARSDAVFAVHKPTFVMGNIRARESSQTEIDMASDVESPVPDDEDSISLKAPNAENGWIALCFGGHLRVERLFLRNNQIANELVMQEHLQRQLFALQKLDINGDDSEEIITCAWDGLTCIYDYQNSVARFQFEFRVQGFCAGNFTDDHNVTSPSFVYVTIDRGIFVYTHIQEAIREIPAFTLFDILQEKIELQDVFDRLEAETSSKIKVAIKNQMGIADADISSVQPLARMSYYAKLLRHFLYNRHAS